MSKFSVAKPRMAAGAAFFNAANELLMVRPTYKGYWDIPGGYVEPGESPVEACKREVREELGISIAVGELLVADWAPSKEEGDKLLWVFAGGTLSAVDESNIRLDESEIAEYRYVSRDRIIEFTIERLANRLLVALHAHETSSSAYLENGKKR